MASGGELYAPPGVAGGRPGGEWWGEVTVGGTFTATATVGVPVVRQARGRSSHGAQRGHRRSSSSPTAGADPGDPEPADPDPDGGDPWPGGFSFTAFDELVSTRLPGHVRLSLFYALPEAWQREAWHALAIEVRS
jgi:hypothetical protein